MNKIVKFLLSILSIAFTFASEPASEMLSPELINRLEKIIDKNQIEELADLLMKEENFDVNSRGLTYSIKEIKDISYPGNSWTFSSTQTNQFTPLTFASSYAKPQIVRLLLQQAHIDLNKGITIENKNHILKTFYPLTIAYTENWSDSSQYKNLLDITKQFLFNKKTSLDHLEQAFDAIGKTIRRFNLELAQQLYDLFTEREQLLDIKAKFLTEVDTYMIPDLANMAGEYITDLPLNTRMSIT